MNIVLLLSHRNLRLFFRDRMNVFFSLLSALLLFLLYALFLGRLQVSSLATRFPHAAAADIHGFVDAWVFAGIIMITTLTTGLGALHVFVEDSATGRFRDFLVSPVRRWQLVLGYLISSYIVSVIMTTIVLVVSQVYIAMSGHTMMTMLELASCYGYILIVAATFSAMSSFIVTFIKSAGAFSSLNTIVGTALGFFAGAYIPLGTMSSGIANFLNSLPFAQAAILIRQPFTAHYVQVLAAGQSEAATSLQTYYDISGSVGGLQLTNGFVVAVFVLFLGLFLLLSVVRITKKIQ